MAQQNLKQPWTPLRRFGQAVKQGFRTKTVVTSEEVEEDNPWFRLARESNRSSGASQARGVQNEVQGSESKSESELQRDQHGANARWLGESASPYGFSDEDGTLKQVDSSNWRKMLNTNRRQRFVPAEPRWQGVPSRTLPTREKTGSTWMFQSIFAIGLVALGLYASHTPTALAAKVDSVYKSVFAKDYSTTVVPAIDNFLSAHHVSVPAWAESGAIRLHVPMAGLIVTDYSTQHPEMVIQGIANEAVLSTGSGVVSKAEALASGSMIVVDHGKLGVTIYDGLGSMAVHRGEYVSSGQILGHLPASGHPELRFSMEQNGHYVNPHDYIVFPSSSA